MRCTAVAVGIGSLLAMSNHCVFATLAPSMQLAEAACPFHSKPKKEQHQQAQVQCCKILRAVVLAKTKTWARDDTHIADLDFYIQQHAIVDCSSAKALPLLLDTGPPVAQSFAELILQRSLLAHAPPLVA